jgi:hypothetical protein
VNRISVTAVAFMLAGAVDCRTASVRPPSVLPSHDDISFRGFAEEVLYGYGTPRTHRFDDYTKGSYHVHASELAKGLFPMAQVYKLRLQAVVVVGPYGGLWAYDVISVIAEEGCTRVNWLLMPHARITVKRSGCVSPHSVSAFLAEVRDLAPSRTRAADEKSCLVIAEAGGLRSSGFGCYVTDGSPELDRMEEALDRLSKDLAVTYSAYPPVEK